MKIYVGNLPFDCDSAQLSELFAPHGEVTSAQIITDRDTGRSRGFGFVEMGDEEGRAAISALEGREMGGRSLTVNEAKPRADRGGRPSTGRSGNRPQQSRW
ncbi:MAG TPA: RNA-binding protein [Acidimicrobiia bacterium]|jgi:RNA recognition motif-containing protein